MKAISPPSTAAIIIHSHHHYLNHRRWFLSLPPPSNRQFHPAASITRPHSLKLTFITKAADSTSQPTSAKTIVTDDGFSLSKLSFGVVGLGVGISLLSYGFGAYFNILPGSEWSAIMLTYGFPLAIIGMALKYAELKPVPCLTYSDAQVLRETAATPILKQGGGIPRRNAPILQMIREEVTEDGKYCLVLMFEAKALELSDFEKRQGRERITYMKLDLFQIPPTMLHQVHHDFFLCS
ncbi:hypothetical protein CXB51_027380 [Gossypium anomalum]|uniref:Thylakoid membrane protein slr0575 n=1 Tax=Gossypium anomalum TaxID=47600 RepID=A0A8J6CK77_9ROSI|nr:hypothetical protein CXB51_027380 [Gossypium anomalum]